MAIEARIKDAADVIDYEFNYSRWLVDTDTVASAVVTVPSGITLVSSANDTTSVTARVSGGTTGTTYLIECLATISDGQKKSKSLNLTIRDQ